MNRAVLNRAVLDCACVGTADVGGVGVMGAYEGEVQPYIKGHITDGSSTFTFKINNVDVTVPVDASGNWKWVVDRAITSLKSAFYNKTNFDECYMYKVVTSGSCETMFYGCSKLKKLTLDNSISDTSYLYNFFYLTSVTDREVVIKNVLFDKCTSARFLFGNCKSIIGSYKLTFEKCTEIYRMFFNYNGETLDLSSADFTKVTSSGQAFAAPNLQGQVSPLKNINIKKIGCDLSFSACPNLTEQSVVNLFNAVAADGIVLTFHQNVWNMIMREIDVQGSPIQVAYQNMIDNYDVTIANASFDAEIEYIEGTGTQWIDTNIKFKPTTVFETRFMEINIPENPDASNRTHIIGTQDYNTRYRLRRIERDSLYFLYGSNGLSWSVGNAKDKIIDIYFSTTTLKYKKDNDNWVEKDISGVEQFVESPDTITLFHTKSSVYIDTNFEGRFYYLKIWDNGNLIADFIPVRKGQVGYMYDKVSGNLFGNSGTGDFILGNDK